VLLASPSDNFWSKDVENSFLQMLGYGKEMQEAFFYRNWASERYLFFTIKESIKCKKHVFFAVNQSPCDCY
jgi:hypothetical protein